MFESFTDRARQVMAVANGEASRLNHEYIATEHILLGLIKVDDGGGAAVLKTLGVDLAKVREQLEREAQPGTELVFAKHPPTPRAKKVVEYAIEEARYLGHHKLGTEHLLLGLLREKEGLAGSVLRTFGVTVETARGAVQALPLAEPEPDSRMSEPMDGNSQKTPVYGNTRPATGRALLALLQQPESLAYLAMRNVGVDMERLQQEVIRLMEKEPRYRE